MMTSKKMLKNAAQDHMNICFLRAHSYANMINIGLLLSGVFLVEGWWVALWERW